MKTKVTHREYSAQQSRDPNAHALRAAYPSAGAFCSVEWQGDDGKEYPLVKLDSHRP